MRCVSGTLLFVVLLLVFVAECKRPQSAAAPPPSITSVGNPNSAKLRDPAWKLAMEGDPLQLAALADHEGARGLLEGVEDGGEVCRTALSALPYADDAELAYGRLGEIAIQASSSEISYVLDALLQIASRARRDTEVLDREGVRMCANALADLANRGRESKKTRATATSILRLLADRREIDPRLLRSDLNANAK